MRAIDAVEKVTKNEPAYLHPHKREIFELLHSASNKEFKWHIAQLIPRLEMTPTEVSNVWDTLTTWVKDPSESKIVRANALQTLFDLTREHRGWDAAFDWIVKSVRSEDVPSLTARIQKLSSRSQ